MRIEFAGGGQEPLAWRGGTLRIGSAADNELRLNGLGVAAHHARLIADRRGIVLQIEPGAGRVYVNARPVRESAIVRLGDALGLGGIRLRLCADAVPDGGHQATSAPGDARATMALRAVAGPLSGRVWPLAGRMELDAQGPLEVTRDDVVRLLPERDAVGMDGTGLAPVVMIRVNGIETRRARLGDGDQLAIGVHRFILDVTPAPGWQARRDPAPPVQTPPARPVHREMGWLIATAVLVALVLAWVLVVHL